MILKLLALTRKAGTACLGSALLCLMALTIIMIYVGLPLLLTGSMTK